ncbi:hypothetical protein LY08_02601 [Olleya aquimaris]|uniref:Uncharacterized protein n=1 Tax=Olleya aquimaris TaxID=639310 RepID=A0A327R7G4_9FLAO|nr:hypothetical protein LY08_02601 [Olleya aquimaris]
MDAKPLCIMVVITVQIYKNVIILIGIYQIINRFQDFKQYFGTINVKLYL